MVRVSTLAGLLIRNQPRSQPVGIASVVTASVHRPDGSSPWSRRGGDRLCDGIRIADADVRSVMTRFRMTDVINCVGAADCQRQSAMFAAAGGRSMRVPQRRLGRTLSSLESRWPASTGHLQSATEQLNRSSRAFAICVSGSGRSDRRRSAGPPTASTKEHMSWLCGSADFR